jgi:hypothetical protein
MPAHVYKSSLSQHGFRTLQTIWRRWLENHWYLEHVLFCLLGCSVHLSKIADIVNHISIVPPLLEIY